MRIVAVALVLAGCPSKGPAGFSGGIEDRWTLPLVGPLEDGLLVTPVTIGTVGPFLFALDPDAPISAVDGDVVKRVGMRVGNGPPRIDETGASQPRIYVEMAGVEVGSLIIERRRAIVVKANTFDSAGRRIHGVLGADVLAEGVVFGFDRDQGIATLIDAASFKAPSGAIAIPYQVVAKNVPAVARRVVKATIHDEALDLHLDLGATASQLREPEWSRVKLATRDIAGVVVDEVGMPRRIAKVSNPVEVTLGPVSSKRVVFVPYGEQRWTDREVAGTLGLGFFAEHDVWAAFGDKTFYLMPRAPLPLAPRLARWETGALHKCVAPGCVTLRLIDPLAGKAPPEPPTTSEPVPGEPAPPVPNGSATPPPNGAAPPNGVAPAPVAKRPGVILSLTREERAGGMPLEVTLMAKDRPELPLVIANLPAHVDRLIDQLPPEFVGVTLEVVDVGPYPRDCPPQLKNGCVDKLAR